jgi:hypothetical protein
MYRGLHEKYRLFFSDLNETWISKQVFKNDLISQFMKIHPVGAELFHAFGRVEK